MSTRFRAHHRLRHPLVCILLLSLTRTVAAADGTDPVNVPTSPSSAGSVVVADIRTDEAVPVGEWARFQTVSWSGETLPIHLRTGYERPLIFPEPIAATEGGPLPGCEVTIDREVVLFSPREHFADRPLTFVGADSGTRYTVSVRADPVGKRIPLRVTVR